MEKKDVDRAVAIWFTEYQDERDPCKRAKMIEEARGLSKGRDANNRVARPEHAEAARIFLEAMERKGAR